MQTNMTNPLATLAEKSKLLQRERINLRDMVLATSKEEQAVYMERLRDIRHNMDSLNTDFSLTIRSGEVAGIYEEYNAALISYLPASKELERLAYNGNVDAAKAMLTGEAFTKVKKVEGTLDQLITMKRKQAGEVSIANTAITNRATLTSIFSLLLVIGASIGMGILLTRLIAHPLQKLKQAAGEVASGNLSTVVEAHSTDEIGSLTESFNLMVENVKNALNDVKKEKAAVEQKVDEAVHSSENQRRYLAQNVEHMLQAMDQFASGDLTVHIHAESDGEIGQLFNGFNLAVGNVRQMLRRVDEATKATREASHNISKSGQELSILAQEQSNKSEEVFMAIEEMVNTIVDNSRTANLMADRTSKNGDIARQGGVVVQQTVEKIRKIASVVNDSASTVEQLGESCQAIGEIVHVIDEIADQTNLLALNAAIEAARAGEQGRGFAVVADEVRKLAERTSGATSEIAEMIQNIQKESQKAVDAMQLGINEVNEGIRLADNAGSALSEVVEGVSDTVLNITQIASASEEQSVKSEQISASAEKISSVSQKAAEGIQQITQSVHSMNELTEQLTRLVGRFEIGSPGENESTVETPPASALV